MTPSKTASKGDVWWRTANCLGISKGYSVLSLEEQIKQMALSLRRVEKEGQSFFILDGYGIGCGEKGPGYR